MGRRDAAAAGADWDNQESALAALLYHLCLLRRDNAAFTVVGQGLLDVKVLRVVEDGGRRRTRQTGQHEEKQKA